MGDWFDLIDCIGAKVRLIKNKLGEIVMGLRKGSKINNDLGAYCTSS